MSSKQTIGIDTAKRVFFLHGEDARGKVILREKLTRERLLPFLANQPVSLIAIEAGCGARHWARALARRGHEVRLVHPKFVRPFVKTNKNDWNDAAAICEAAQRPTMRFVATKSLEQQDLLAAHRIRARLVGQRTGLCNQIRGLLAEYGIVLPQAISRLRRGLPEALEDAENELTVQGRELIASLREEPCELEERIKPYEQAIERASVDSVTCRRLRSIPGIGPIGARAVVATMGDPKAFRNGRHFAAFLGLVPASIALAASHSLDESVAGVTSMCAESSSKGRDSNIGNGLLRFILPTESTESERMRTLAMAAIVRLGGVVVDTDAAAGSALLRLA
jgi:transposase